MAWIVLFAVKVEHVSNVGRGRGVDLARLHWFLPIDCEGWIIPDGRDRLRRLEGRLTGLGVWREGVGGGGVGGEGAVVCRGRGLVTVGEGGL